MALGFRKKKGEPGPGSGDQQVEQEAKPAASKRKRKPNERLASVVKESAPGAAIDVLARNEAFVLPRGAGWLVLLLNVDTPSFGGLSVKHKGDEAKGSIIELITADHIEVVVTAEMLEEEVLGIVPTAETLERMSEFSLFTGAAYAWGVMMQAEDGSLLANPVDKATYAEATSISTGRLSVQERLPEVWAWALGEEPPEAVAEEDLATDEPDYDAADSEPPAPEPQEGFADESQEPFGAAEAPAPAPAPEPLLDPEDEGAVDYGAMDAEYADAAANYDDDVDYGDGADEGDAYGGLDDGGDLSEYVAANYEREVDEDEVRETLVRRLSPEDLDLEIDVEEFARAFSTDAPSVRIEVGHADAWLADQVADYVRQANAQIEKMHADHGAELLREYVSLMSLHSEKVTRDFSPSRPGTQYYELMNAARADFEEDKRRGADEVARERQDISRRFESEADEVARAAADAAKARFHAQNRVLRERLLSEAGLSIEARNEERFAHNRKVLLDMRRRDASLAMELGSTKAMQLLAERQDAQRKQQTALLKEWTDRITAFIDDNRKQDVARTETLAEQLRHTTQVQELTDQFAREREAMAAQHAERIRELEAEVVANRERAVIELREREAQWGHSLEMEQQKTVGAHSLVASLEEQMRGLGESYKSKYDQQIATLREDKESYARELERANHIQSRANKILVVLVIVMTLAALAVGMIVGWSWSNAGASAMVLPLMDGTGLPAGGAMP